jgi:excisionase family DNA binding protein
MSRLFSVPEVAERLNVSVHWVRRAVFEKRFPVVHVGRLVRIDERDLEAFIQENRDEGYTEAMLRARRARRKRTTP